MALLRSFTSFLTLIAFSASTSLSVYAAPQIPDEIDVQKYKSIYLQSKSVSDAARSDADSYLYQARQIDGQIQSKQNEVSQSENQINYNDRLIPQLESEISGLQRENQDLQSQVRSHEIDRGVTERDFNQTTSALNQVNHEYDIESRELNKIEQDVNQSRIQLARVQDEIRASEQNLANYQNASRSLRFEIDSKTKRLKEIENEIQSYSNRLPRLEQELDQKRREVPTQTAQVQRMQEELRALNGKVQSLKNDSDAAKKQLDNAQSELNKIQGEIQTLTKRLEQLDQEYSLLQNKIPALERNIPDTESQITAQQNNLNNLNQQLSAIAPELNSIESKINEASANINSANQKITEIDKNIQMQQKRKDAALKLPDDDPRKKQLLDQIEAALSDLNRQRSEQSSIVADNVKIVDGLKSRFSELRKQKDSLQANINQTNSTIIQLNQRLAQQRQELNQARQRLSQIAPDKSQTEQNLNRVKSQINQLESQVADARRKYQDAQSSLHSVLPEVSKVEAKYNDAARELTDLRNAVTRLEAQVNNAKRQLAELQREQRQVEQDLKTGRQQLIAYERSIQDTQSDLNRLSQLRVSIERKYQDAVRDENNQRNIVNQIVSQINSLQARYNSLQQDLSRLVDLINSKNNQINVNVRNIANDESRIRDAKSETLRLSQLITKLLPEIEVLKKQSAPAWDRYRVADQKALQLELDTQTKYAKYQEVQTLYDTKLAKAQLEGESQGKAYGAKKGDTEGASEGIRLGNLEGAAEGKSEGLLYGYNQGKALGEKEGKENGYKDGLDSAQAADEGYKLGLIQGEKDAYLYAHQVFYPKAYSERKAELLKSIPSKEIDIDNRQSFLRENSPLVLDRLNASLAAEFMPVDLMNSSSKDLALVGEILEKASDEALFRGEGDLTFLTLVIKDRSAAQCNFGYVDFDNACLASYDSAYETQYSKSYGAALLREKPAAFKAAKDIAFNTYKDSRKKEGYDEVYPGFYADLFKKGAAEANQKAFLMGQKDGYNQKIAEATKVETNKGLSEASQYFQQNPVLRLMSASVVKINDQRGDEFIMAGDEIALQVQMANLGFKDSQKGFVKIKLESLSGNVIVDQRAVDLASIPSQVKANVSYVSVAKIAEDAGDEPAVLKVTATMPNGEVQELMVTIQLKLHIFSKSEFKYDATPSVYGTIGRNHPPATHTVKLTLINDTRFNAQKDFKIYMKLPELYGLRATVDEANVSALRAGEQQTVTFKYRTSSSQLVGQEVDIVFEVYYGTKLSNKEAIRVKFNRGY